MRVLVIGHYRDGSGYARACNDYALALDTVGVDVLLRCVKLNDTWHEVSTRLKELESKDVTNPDICIQHTLPHYFDYCGDIPLNVGAFASETTHFKGCTWADHCNLMDLVWVFSEQSREACINSGVLPNKIIKIPHCVDTELLQRSYPTFESLKKYKDEGKFLFLFVGEAIRRKNLAALLRAFHTEFLPEEEVELVIKTSVPMSREEAEAKLQNYCTEIKNGLKLYRRPNEYKQEIVILDRLTEEGMMKLHASADVLVAPSYGEAAHIPAMISTGLGVPVIYTDWGGFREYLSEEEGYPVKYRLEPVFGIMESFHDLYQGTEEWASIDISHLRQRMREALDTEKRKRKALAGIKKMHLFSYERIGTLMKETLCQALNNKQLHSNNKWRTATNPGKY